MSTPTELTLLVRGDALRTELDAERARADHAEQLLELERRTTAALRGLAQLLIERLDRTPPTRTDGPGDVW